MTEKSVAYYRTSSATNVDGDSLPRQRAAVESFARSAGYQMVDEFYDAAVSGADDLIEREGFAALLDRIENNGVRTVIVESSDRLARTVIAQEVGILALQERGVRLLTSSGMDLTSDEDETKVAMRQIAAVFSQLEKSRLVRKLRVARERKRATGVKVEGRPSYAEMAPELVRQAKRLRRRNPRTGKQRSYAKVSAELFELGFTNTKGQPLARTQIRRITG